MNSFYWLFYTLFKSAARALFSHKVIHREKLIEDGPVLIVANHESFVDPPMLGICYEEGIYFLARKTLFKGIFAWGLPKCQAIPVDQENPDPQSLKLVIQLLKEGNRVLIFPEGARFDDGNIHEGKAGVGLILSKTRVPVQPLRIHGAREILPVGSSRIHFHPISITVGDPINFTQEELNARGKKAYVHLAHRMMDAIKELPVSE